MIMTIDLCFFCFLRELGSGERRGLQTGAVAGVAGAAVFGEGQGWIVGAGQRMIGIGIDAMACAEVGLVVVVVAGHKA